MITRKLLSRRALVMLLTAVVASACTGNSPGVSLSSTSKEVQAMNVGSKMVPPASSFTTAPLRNRIRVEFKAPVSEVWALIGNLTRFPEYSSGLERVETKEDLSGRCTEYVCYFKPQEEGGESIVERELVRWYEPNRGYASSGEEGNAFGVKNDLNLVILEPSKGGTILTWDEYYDAQDLDMMKAHFDQAFADIAENLIRRFGGAVVTRYVDR